MTLGWAFIFAYASLLNPLSLLSGLLAAMFAKRWWHLLAAVLASLAIQSIWSGNRGTVNMMMPFMAAAAIFWAFVFYKTKAVFSSE